MDPLHRKYDRVGIPCVDNQGVQMPSVSSLNALMRGFTNYVLSKLIGSRKPLPTCATRLWYIHKFSSLKWSSGGNAVRLELSCDLSVACAYNSSVGK